MTGCGCLLLVAALIGLLWILIFGSTDPGEPIAEAIALVVAAQAVARIAGARSPQPETRS